MKKRLRVELFWQLDGKEEHYWFTINERNKTKVRNLITEYKEKDDAYNVDDLLKFLKEKGYKVKESVLSADVSIEF